MFCSIGYEVPISYFGFSVLFIVFAIVLVITQAIFQIFEAQNTI
jgi:hypothetical protein